MIIVSLTQIGERQTNSGFFYYEGSTEIVHPPGYISELDKEAVNIFYP